ncbi:CDF family Co(II)/Ni(II) efflux transporter DmeF [Sphingomonas changnyeongensis]|uniref:CDF family Co(II)/Ni(II) efflux transporter DmeF n=1 Tax=Sphingomonas changnyeongensis TaxID=2698679 RepID=A0A7Z2S5A9_9SPHN|nr:CDF family Co(II)/Ni(II) efflux transporter DmeF [Sphingomonas changnyeongensis]QHL90885.1 CDF family Co(II)/Ni(II) efflux transporter DmeF [Sphingomonas changnyeongensis]
MSAGTDHGPVAALGAGHQVHERRTLWVVALAAITMLVEIAAGLATGSMALLADGIHMATHVGALGLAAFAYRYARRHAADPRFVFGTGKVGDLAGFASALMLGVFAIGIAAESVDRLFAPGAIAYGEALWVAGLGLAVNLASALLLAHDHDHPHDHDHGHDHHHGAHGHHHDHNLRSAYFHVLADALTSVLAIAALLAGLYLGWRWLDAAAGIAGALVIAHWALGLMRTTGLVLVDATADPGLAARLRAAVEDEATEVVDLRCWRIGPGRFAALIALHSAQPLPVAAYRARLAGQHGLAWLWIGVSGRSAAD